MKPASDRIRDALKASGNDRCKACGFRITEGDLSWNNPTSVIDTRNQDTGSGTDSCAVRATCPKCQAEVFYFEEWGSIDAERDLADMIERHFVE